MGGLSEIIAGMGLPEDDPLPDIEAFFASRKFRVVVHEEPPPEPTPDEWRRMSSASRRARRDFGAPYWADLQRIETSKLVRWYGAGETPEAAIRSARKRYRVEEADY